jgi:hypothetical protein
MSVLKAAAGPRTPTLAKTLGLLARIDAGTRGMLMRQGDLFLRLTQRPDLLEQLALRPGDVRDVLDQLARPKPELGEVLSGIRRFAWSRPMHIAV